MTSSTSGIEVSAELKSAYQSARSGNQTAFIKVQIVNDVLVGVHTERKGGFGSNSGGGWASDFDAVARKLDDDEPCFIIFFKGRDDLLLLQYVPESASVKHKMSYSSSKNALNTLLNARQFASSGASSGNSKQVEQYFGTTKSEFTHKAYSAHKGTRGPMSEVEEALAELPKTIDKKDFGRSMGYSLLATVSGKALPPQLANYASGNAAQTSANLYRGGAHNFHAKPSAAKAANASAGGGFNPKLPGWGGSPTSAGSSGAKSLASPSADSAAHPSPSQAAAAYNAAVSQASAAPQPKPKCLVAACDNRRFKNGYCADCLQASEARRAAVFAGTEKDSE